jgi:hypothetical protein
MPGPSYWEVCDAVIAQPFWRSIFSATTRQVQGYATHPNLYHHFNGVWLT